MDIDSIVNTIKSKNPDEIKLLYSLRIIRNHIDYCRKYNINMCDDPLLARVLLWR